MAFDWLPMYGLALFLFCLVQIHRGFCGPIHYQMVEELPMNTTIGNVANDGKLRANLSQSEYWNLRFGFLGMPGDIRGKFSIDERTGVIRTAQRIDRDQLCPQKLSCFAKMDVAVRPMKYFRIVKVAIEILDLNDNWPKFPSDKISHTVLESAKPGTSFNIPAAKDPDSSYFAIKNYALVTSSDKFKLKLERNTVGDISIKLVQQEHLDREAQSVYRMSVLAIDGGSPPKTGTILVNIVLEDTNDNSPRFKNVTYEVDIDENIPIGTTVMRVTAVDPDEGSNGKVVYGLSKHTTDNLGHLFDIDSETGDLFVKGTIDYEENQIYLLSVSAQDKGQDSLPVFQSVVVRIRDLNDNAPHITLGTLTGDEVASISESSNPGTFVAYASVADPDSGRNGDFSCILKSPKFRLVPTSKGEFHIVSTATFDREIQDHYLVILECRDRARKPRIRRQWLNVKVVDINDHKPEFPLPIYHAGINENNRIGASVILVNATDQDIGVNAQLVYKLDKCQGDNVLKIDPASGLVTATVPLDYEQIQHVECQVLVSDSGSPSRSASTVLYVQIKDVNDERPKFSKVHYVFAVAENKPVRTRVGKVSALDADTKPYDEFLYSLDRNHNGFGYFAIDPKDGVITTQAELDRERQSIYHLRVLASDAPGLSSSVTVTVHVSDENDNGPVFDFPRPLNNTVIISTETPVGHVITRIIAHDEDAGNNALLSLDLTNRNRSIHPFAVDSITGAVSLSSQVDNLKHEEFRLLVIAKDHGRPPRSAETILNIIVDQQVPFKALHSPLLSGTALILVVSLSAFVSVLAIIIITAVVIILRRQRNIKRTNRHKALHIALTNDHSQTQGVAKAHQDSLTELAKVEVCQDTYTATSNKDCDKLDSNCCNNTSWDSPIIHKQMKQSPDAPPRESVVTLSGEGMVLTQSAKQMVPVPPLNTNNLNNLPRHRLIYNPNVGFREYVTSSIRPKEAGIVQMERESDSGSTEGSNTDSGHGPSEDGDTTIGSHQNPLGGSHISGPHIIVPQSRCQAMPSNYQRMPNGYVHAVNLRDLPRGHINTLPSSPRGYPTEHQHRVARQVSRHDQQWNDRNLQSHPRVVRFQEHPEFLRPSYSERNLNEGFLSQNPCHRVYSEQALCWTHEQCVDASASDDENSSDSESESSLETAGTQIYVPHRVTNESHV